MILIYGFLLITILFIVHIFYKTYYKRQRERLIQKAKRELELKRLDALNSFVFNVDTKSELVDVYGRYHLRNEPLDTLEKIQDAYMRTTKEELQRIALELLDSRKIQIFVVGDKNINVAPADGKTVTLEEDLKNLAHKLDLPFEQIALR